MNLVENHMLKLFIIPACALSLVVSTSIFAAPNKNAYKNANQNASFKNGKHRDNDDFRDRYDRDRDRDRERYGDYRYDRDDRDWDKKGKKGKKYK